MKLSKNFRLNEFTASATAIRTGVSNVPDEAALSSIKALAVQLMQPLRDSLGKSIKITSGYRSPALNKAVGSTAKKSQHMRGEACDFTVDGMTPFDVCKFIVDSDLEYDQLIYEGTWVHISYSGNNKKQVLTAIFGDKVTYAYGLIKT